MIFTVRHRDIPEGNEGNLVTLDRMRALIRGASPTLVLFFQSESEMGTVLECWRWVRDHMRFALDPAGTESITSPDRLLSIINRDGFAYGDCDEYVVLLGACLRANSISVSLVAVSLAPENVWNHVYCAAYLDGGHFRLPLDPTADAILPELRGRVVPGWEITEDVTERVEVPV